MCDWILLVVCLYDILILGFVLDGIIMLGLEVIKFGEIFLFGFLIMIFNGDGILLSGLVFL